MEYSSMPGIVDAVSASAHHTFSKINQPVIRLLAGLGVADDAHLGTTVKHRSRVAVDPTQPNLRQVHLLHAELFDELRAAGFHVAPGALGENVTTRRLELLRLPTGALLHLGATAVIEITGLRNPCGQINRYQAGLMAAVLGRDALGNLVRKTGVMSIVRSGGEVLPGDPIEVELPPAPHRALGVV